MVRCSGTMTKSDSPSFPSGLLELPAAAAAVGLGCVEEGPGTVASLLCMRWW